MSSSEAPGNHTTTSKWFILLDAILLSIFIFLGYQGGLTHGFVYDDKSYILGNQLVIGKSDLQSIFTSTYPPNHPEQGLYRPLVTLSYVWDYKMAGGLPQKGQLNTFHLTNVVLHIFNTILLLLLLYLLGLGRWQRFCSALLYGLHPGLSEDVIWIVGRADLMSAFFGILAIFCLFKKSGILGWIGYVFFLIGALLSKETGALIPFLGALLWWFKNQKEASNQRVWLTLGIVSAVTLITFGFLRYNLIGSWHPSLAAYEGVVSTEIRIFTALKVLWKYIALWFFPYPLSVHHEIPPTTNILWVLLSTGGWIFVFWLAWKYRKSFPWFGLCLLWFWIGMSLTSNLIIPVGAVYGERFAYIPFLLFAPTTVLGAGLFLERYLREQKTILTCLLMFAISVLEGGLLWNRIPDWKNDITLWRSALSYYPNSFAIKSPLAESLLFAGDFEQARILSGEAIDQLENQPEIYRKLFLSKLENIEAASKSGVDQKRWLDRFMAASENAQNLRIPEALEEYKKLTIEFPEQAATFDALGDLYVRLKNPMAAYQNYEEALRLGLRNSILYAKYAQVLSELGKKAEAILAYEEAIKINPRDFLIQYNYGIVLGELEDFQGALKAFHAANKISPAFAAPRVNAAAILIHLKDYEEAKQEIQIVMNNDPKAKEELTKAAKKLLELIPAPTKGKK